MISKLLISSFLFFTSLSLIANDLHVAIIDIVGNDKTKDAVILRELLFQKDSTYSDKQFPRLIDQSRNRLLNLNLFNDVQILHELDNVTITVVEKWYIWPIPFLEFSDRNFNVWQDLDFGAERTNYGLYTFLYNLHGRNHTLKTKLKTGYHDKIGVEYRIPFVNGSNTSLEFLLEYEAQDEVWLTTLNDKVNFYKNGKNSLIKTYRSNAEIAHRYGWSTTAYAGLGFEHGRLDNSVTQVNDYFFNSSNTQNVFSIKIGLEEDTRDNIFFPTRGYYMNPEMGLNNFYTNSFQNSYYFKLKLQTFNQLAGRLHSAVSINGSTNTLSYLPYSHRKILGYDEAVRGFEKYVIDGINGVNGSVAVRLKILDDYKLNLPFVPIENYSFLPISMYLETYGDAGFVYQEAPDESNKLPNQRIGSVGVGLNTLFYNDRVLRLEYSYNSLQEGGFFVHFKKAI